MGREIKFRVWCEEKKEMLPLQKMSFKTGKCMPYGWNMSYKFDDVMQYTGIKDINDVEIYEGDILIQYDGTKRFVGYKNGSFTYTNIPELDQTHNTFSMFYTEFTNPISEGWEVLGNIYENPELLEAAE